MPPRLRRYTGGQCRRVILRGIPSGTAYFDLENRADFIYNYVAWFFVWMVTDKIHGFERRRVWRGKKKALGFGRMRPAG